VVRRFAIIDFETAGTQPSDGIIEVGITVWDGVEEINYSQLVNPGRKIPIFIQKLTGISDLMVSDAPVISDILPDILPLLDDAVVVAHNAAFDVGFLQHALTEEGYSPFNGYIIDTIELTRILFPDLGSLQLSFLTSYFELEHAEAHRALSDARATSKLLQLCIQKARELPLITLQRLVEMTRSCRTDLSELFSWIENERMTRVEEEDSYSYRQFSLNVREWTDSDEERRDPSELEAFSHLSFDEVFDDWQQKMEEAHEHFESRPSQKAMMQEVALAYEQNQHLMAEAGTGTGKSLGYLLPSLYWGMQQGEKVVVSTHTINLQEQLYLRDVPVLKQMLPIPFQAAVLKGRSHYLCLRKYEQNIVQNEYEANPDDSVAASQLLVWLSQTKTGDVEEVQLGGRKATYWRTVQSDADSCLNRSCPWFRHCFYHRARNKAQQADVIITNHSLLFTDMKAEHRILPSHPYLVIDEAHHLEDVASQHLGVELHYGPLNQSFQRFYRDSKNGQLSHLLIKMRVAGERWTDYVTRFESNLQKLLPLRESIDRLFAGMMGALEKNSSQNEIGQLVYRIPITNPLTSELESLVEIERDVHVWWTDWLKDLEQTLISLKEEDEDGDWEGSTTDLMGYVKDFYRFRDAMNLFFAWDDALSVYWMEGNPAYGLRSVAVKVVPTDVSQHLHEKLFQTKESVVLTSATLSVNQSFDYVAHQLGLVPSREKGRLRTLQVESPFDYPSQALMVVPTDFPQIKGGSDSQFIDRLVQSLAEVSIELKGRMLVLFTSNRMLRDVHNALKPKLEPYSIEVLGQGIDGNSRSKLTHLFKNHDSAVLLGTSSFWEGVDIPGDALSCVAIVRLPFSPPNHPIVEAKTERLKKENKNAFMSLSVPQAVIRFKQGFGRLIRTKLDRGVVIVYDTRIVDTTYGRHFVESLPKPKIERLPSIQIAERIREWMAIPRA
jgi:ATP-dependent DNA helicase DinG